MGEIGVHWEAIELASTEEITDLSISIYQWIIAHCLPFLYGLLPPYLMAWCFIFFTLHFYIDDMDTSEASGSQSERASLMDN
ncbi:hypothetical protein EYC84_008643 [Monilinia fructicola]|uniref:Uncharacterized protein n=1 Tax=Monilinia fructicola TaxID=38448 RepID=A0A5M9JFW0_MONFR|nr:hypothetical protein EYC84_008643 [Monilinia fructicola]